MTLRNSIFDPLDNSPVPSPSSWAGRQRPSLAYDEVMGALRDQAFRTAERLMTQHRDGIIPPAEKIVLDCLRALHAIPKTERMYADTLTDVISRGFLETAWGLRNHKRRAHALLRIAGRASP